jgi:hypothetical protein
MEMELDLVLNGLMLNSSWKWQEPKVLEIKKTFLKVGLEVPSKEKKLDKRSLELGPKVSSEIKNLTSY